MFDIRSLSREEENHSEMSCIKVFKPTLKILVLDIFLYPELNAKKSKVEFSVYIYAKYTFIRGKVSTGK